MRWRCATNIVRKSEGWCLIFENNTSGFPIRTPLRSALSAGDAVPELREGSGRHGGEGSSKPEDKGDKDATNALNNLLTESNKMTMPKETEQQTMEEYCSRSWIRRWC